MKSPVLYKTLIRLLSFSVCCLISDNVDNVGLPSQTGCAEEI